MANREPDFVSDDGNPVYWENDRDTGRRVRVVVMPDGKAYYADANGRPTRPRGSAAAGALLGGLVGLLWGPIGALLGAGIGALLSVGAPGSRGG